jgi:hypothetical protein
MGSLSLADLCAEIKRDGLEEWFWSNVKVNGEGCMEWQGSIERKGGYGRWRGHGAHRIAYWLANGAFPEDLAILHRCDNPPCINPAHTRPGTLATNCDDRYEKGRYVRWPKDQKPLFAPAEIAQIQRLYAGGSTVAELADHFNIAVDNIKGFVEGIQVTATERAA